MIKELDIKKKLKVALYARVSTEEQARGGFSLAAQLELLRKHASDNNYEVYGEYVDDGYSGTSDDRPHFLRLFNDAVSGKFDIILVYRIDRFFRNTKELLGRVDDLAKFDVKLKSITEPFDSSYLGRFLLSFLGSLAQLECDTFRERSKMGKLRRYREGYYSGSSPSKFGYDYSKETKKLEINKKEAEIVRLIFSLYNQPDSSITKVTRKLRELGMKTKTGRQWETDRVNDVLRDDMYKGIWHANRLDTRKDSNKKIKPKEEWIEVRVPQIVPEEIFDSAQKLLEARKNYSERNVKYKYLLQNLVRCGDCSSTMAGTADKAIQKKNGKEYGPYYKLYYRCTHFLKNQFEKLVKCRLKYVKAEDLESVVWNEIEKILQNPELVEKAIVQKDNIVKGSRVSLQQEIETIDRRLLALSKEHDRVIEAYRHDAISIEKLKAHGDDIKEKSKTLEARKQELASMLRESDIKQDVKEAVDYIARIKQGIKKFTFETKKSILKFFNTRIKVNINGEVDIDCTIPKINPSIRSLTNSLPRFALAGYIYLP